MVIYVLMGICRETVSSNGHVYTGWSPGVFRVPVSVWVHMGVLVRYGVYGGY